MRNNLIIVTCIGLSFWVSQAMAAPLILNEYNAVAKKKDLDKSGSDSYFGQISGNGGDWIELVVVEDHLDVRSWTLQWFEDNEEGNGQTSTSGVWDPSRVSGNEAQGIITFADDLFWSDLRAGTIITISEKDSADTFDLSTDTSFDPATGDWWIHVCTRGEAAGQNPLLTTAINVDDDPVGSFTVGKDDWELTIVDETASVIYGPIGEGVSNWGGGGVGSTETGRLEADPSETASVADYDDAYYSSFGSPNTWSDYTETQDFSALRAWSEVPEPSTWVLLVGLAGLITLFRKK